LFFIDFDNILKYDASKPNGLYMNLKPSLKELVLAVFKREILLDLPVFGILIPLVVLIAHYCRKFDRILNLPEWQYHFCYLALFAVFTIIGIIIVWWAYSYLVIIGQGSPGPHLGGTKKLVTTGPYALFRHPSVVGKLLGVIGLGFFYRSFIFMFVVVPALLLFSILFNIFLQERDLIKQFGQNYIDYKKETPLIIPTLRSAKKFLSSGGQ
jgi:protein-S-isoprenylcysteine O-methyltransferase Ste14